MAMVRIATYIEEGQLVFRMDNVEVINGSGKYEMDLASGSHVLQWYVSGVAGTSYSISVSSSKTAEFQLTRKIAKTGKDFGGFEFGYK